MKTKIVTLLLICAMMLVSLPFTVFAVEPDSGKGEIPFGPSNSDIEAYTYEEFNMMTVAEAEAANVPEGYTGDYVLELKGTNQVGFILEKNVSFDKVKSVTFRVWCSENTKEFRLTNTRGTSWIVRCVPEQKGTWLDLVYSPTSDNYDVGASFNSLKGKDGSFGAVNVGFRFLDNVTTSVYVDSITFDMAEDDTVAPQINYNGSTDITTTAGKNFVFDGSFFDEYENRSIEPEFVWSDGAVDENGLLKEGDHVCKVIASDVSGNSSELTLNVHVVSPDTAAPTILFGSDVINVTVGTVNMLTVAAVDDYDTVTPTLTWSDGAFDAANRFIKGVHTVTVSVSDLSGNTATKLITVNVTDVLEITNELICD